MIVHVWRRALAAEVGPVVVACADRAIADAVESAGGRAVLTDPNHPTGSDRIHEAIGGIDPGGRHDAVVNVQGDLPLLDPADASAPDIGSGDWYVVVEATDEPTLRQLADQRFGRHAKLPRAETIAFGTYRLLWDLAKAEL